MKKAVYEVVDLTHDGRGVLRDDGLVVFVEDAIPGDCVRYELVKKKKSFALGTCTHRVVDSPQRVEAPCAHFGACGGCAIQSMRYDYQLEYKQARVQRQLDPVLSSMTKIHPILGMVDPFFYRNHMQFHVRDQKLCLYSTDSTQLVAIQKCWISEVNIEPFADVLAQHSTPDLQQVLFRYARGECLVGLVTKTGDLPVDFIKDIAAIKGVRGVSEVRGYRFGPSRLICGEKYLYHCCLGLTYRMDVQSFVQVSTKSMEKLYKKVLQLAGDVQGKAALELYGGMALMGGLLAKRGAQVRSVESLSLSFENASWLKINNQLDSLELIHEKAEAYLQRDKTPADLVLVDPPRAGLEQSVLEGILNLAPERIVYVSCNPSTLARDIQKLRERYEISELQCVDLFAHTMHVEMIVVLSSLELEL